MFAKVWLSESETWPFLVGLFCFFAFFYPLLFFLPGTLRRGEML